MKMKIQMKKHSTFNLQPRILNEDARTNPSTLNVERSRFNVSAIRFGALIAMLVMAQMFTAYAQPTSGPVNYSTFSKFISDRNIFNPNRRARDPNVAYRPRTRTVVRRNSFGLAGMISYDEGENAGIHAFFDGTSADYRKVLQPGGTIAIFKVGAIMPDSVTLLSDTNTIVLKIGQQMRDDGQGHWSLSPETVNYAKNSSGDSRNGRRNYNGQRNENGEAIAENSDTNAIEGGSITSDGGDEGDQPMPDAVETPAENIPAEATPPPSGPGSDVLRRLMELRAQEEQSGNRN